jgi:hypothetical protein
MVVDISEDFTDVETDRSSGDDNESNGGIIAQLKNKPYCFFKK